MNVTTKPEERPALTSLVISPNLQALLEFDDRLRASSESHKRPEVASSSRTHYDQHPSWGEQEVPTVSLPPPRRRKKSSVPASPKTISESEGVSPSVKSIPETGEFGGSEEVVCTRPVDIPEETEVEDLTNPYLNSPPSPRYFHQRSGDGIDGTDQLSAFYAWEKSRSVGREKRERSSSEQSQQAGGQSVSPHSTGGNVGSRQKERGECSFL